MSSSLTRIAMSSSCWDTSRSELIREIQILKKIQFNNKMNETIQNLLTIKACCGYLTIQQEEEIIKNLYPWLHI